MNDRLYTILETFKDPFDVECIYEKVRLEGGLLGVRCRKYVSHYNLCGYLIDTIPLRYQRNFTGYLADRFKYLSAEKVKFEAFAICSPEDHFNFEIGKEKSKRWMNRKIKRSRYKIYKHFQNLKTNNLPYKVNMKI